jgi:hypothetical protein
MARDGQPDVEVGPKGAQGTRQGAGDVSQTADLDERVGLGREEKDTEGSGHGLILHESRCGHN